MFVVKFNHKACKYSKINLISLDKSYLIYYTLMQVGFIFGTFTYFGYTDLTIDYLYKNHINSVFISQVGLLEFFLRGGFLFEIVASFMLFARILHYPVSKLLQLWMIYLEYIYNNIQNLGEK